MISKLFSKSVINQPLFKACVSIIWDLSLHCCSFTKTMNTKPPNILVYTGDKSFELFKKIEKNILECLKTDTYLIYHLLSSEVNNYPWMENTLLLVLSSDVIESSVAPVFETFFKEFGNILLVCSKYDNCLFGIKCHQILEEETLILTYSENIGKVHLFRGKYSYSDGIALCYDNNKKPLIRKAFNNKNILITSEIFLDRDLEDSNLQCKYKTDERQSLLKHILTQEFGLEGKDDSYIPVLTPGYYITDNECEINKLIDKLKIGDISSDKQVFYECRFQSLGAFLNLPIYFFKDSFHSLSFDRNMYFSRLHTNVYGHNLVYFPVITSTMDAADQLSEYEGIIIVSDYQISGKGRGDNKWISPKGCAMFTLHFTISLNSHLGKRMSLLQHIAALAVVCGIKSQQYANLDLKVKWPNDIYHGKTKVGGLLVRSTIQSNTAHINIGWGINVENSRPTACINDVIDECNLKAAASPLPHLHKEEVIAFTMTQMEFLVNDFNKSGSGNFFELYYSHWMHSNQEVTLSDFNTQGVVIGIDDYGFLKVKNNQDKVLVLQPGGNRFDIMKNLIYAK